jgi:transcriptional regulator with XRE-family HTH domain
MTTAPQQVGAGLRKGREALGLTVVQAAALIGCSQASVTLREQGRRDMGIAALIAHAAALGLDARDLLPGPPDSPWRAHAITACEWLRKAPRIPARAGLAVVAGYALEEIRAALATPVRAPGEGVAGRRGPCGKRCKTCLWCDCLCADQCTEACHENAQDSGAHKREKANAA